MSAGPILSSLSHEQKDALIAALMTQVASLTARVGELEAKLGLPPKTPDNSSVPPSKGQKPSECSAPKDKAKPHAGAHRPLHPNPTSKREVLACCCQGCGTDVSDVAQSLCESYDRIEIPEIQPDVTRVSLYGGVCPCCAKRFKAEPARLCGLSALRSGDSPGAIEPCAARPVWPGDQRGRAGQHSFRQPEALRGADEPDQGAADGRHGAGLG